MFKNLRSQYERFPYPPIPFLALPRRKQGQELKYENAGPYLSRSLSSSGIRILVIGGGTLEPLVVSMAHPHAREIVNVDLSLRSIELLNRRLRFFNLARPFSSRAPIKSLNGDFTEMDLGLFDYVIASNVLHHTPDPAYALAKASSFLKPGGVLRMVTYPSGSRLWMRATSEYLKSEGVDKSPNIKKAALEAVRLLSITDPVRTTFESHPERGTNAGVIDAFFNACENPLTPLEWQDASENAGLSLIGESQDEGSRSSLVDNVATGLTVWEKLQIMDDTWELCANPILWFEKRWSPSFGRESRHITQSSTKRGGPPFEFKRADDLLRKGGSCLLDWRDWLRKEVGPRVWPNQPDEILRGLSILEYPVDEILRETTKDC
jgi:SAM-dependent methyltransferase